MSTFNFGHQNAASIQNIEGDARSIHASVTWETLELRRTIAQTREQVAGLGLSPPVLESVSHSLDAAAQEADATRPDRYKVGEHLGAVAHTLKEAGALAGAGIAVRRALCRATELLGPAGLATIAAVL